MSDTTLLVLYCAAILVASLVGGWLPMLVRLTHRRLELAISFVSGVMAGIALLHLLPHAIMERSAALAESGRDAGVGHEVLEPVTVWLLAGFLLMFVLERFFCFHHHDPPPEHQWGKGSDASSGDLATTTGGCKHVGAERHSLTWTGAAVGLSIHSVIAGGALAASVASTPDTRWPGLATFLVIVLHKPFDSMTLGTLLAVTDRPMGMRHVVNGLFALAIPVGVAGLALGLAVPGADRHLVLSAALALSTGMFLCIALSDLLPELQFHQHDRVKLTAALLLGLALAWGIGRLEALQHGEHGHDHAEGHDHALVEPPPATLTAIGPGLSSPRMCSAPTFLGTITRPR